MRSCFIVDGLESGGFAIGGGGCQGIGIVDDLIDGVDGLAFARAAADVEDPGDQMVVNVAGIGEGLEFGFLLHDEGGNSNGLGTMTAKNGAELIRHCGRCHENDSLDLDHAMRKGENTRTPQGMCRQGYVEKWWKKSDLGHGGLVAINTC